VAKSPDTTIGGSNTLLSLVSKNYLAGMARDAGGRLYVAGPNTNTVTVYAPPLPGANNSEPIGKLTVADGLSQPGGLALDVAHGILYVANTGNGTVTMYAVTTVPVVGFQKKDTLSGLSAPLGLALNPSGSKLFIANRGKNTILVAGVSVTTDPSPTVTFSSPTVHALQDLTGPLGIALNPAGTRLYVAGNGKVNKSYSVTMYAIDQSTGLPTTPAAHIGGDKTGICNPASVAVDPSGTHLYVANRESSGGSITVYNLNVDGSLVAPTDFNVQPAAMMLHDTVNQLGAPVGLVVATEPPP